MSDPSDEGDLAAGYIDQPALGKAHLRQSKLTLDLNESLQPPAFLRAVEKDLCLRFAREGGAPKTHLRSRLVQFWFGGDRQIHYEVSVHERMAQIELGLHFEAAPARNHELYLRFERELIAIQASLGSSIWLEEWDRGWARIYETQPLWPLDAARVETIVDRMSSLIATFQPLLDA